MNQNEIILYQPDNSIKLEVMLENETVWLTQLQMAALFNQTKQNVSLHINNCFREQELERDSTVKDSLIVQKEGNRSVKRNIEYYKDLGGKLFAFSKLEMKPAELMKNLR